MYYSGVMNSATCFGTPHVPSSCSVLGCYRNACKWSVVW